MTRKLSWSANITRPDLSFTALRMSKMNTSTIINDLWDVYHVIRRWEKERVVLSCIKLSCLLTGPWTGLKRVSKSNSIYEKKIRGFSDWLVMDRITLFVWCFIWIYITILCYNVMDYLIIVNLILPWESMYFIYWMSWW